MSFSTLDPIAAFCARLPLCESSAVAACESLHEYSKSDRSQSGSVLGRFFKEGRVFDLAPLSFEEIVTAIEDQWSCFQVPAHEIFFLECVDRLREASSAQLVRLAACLSTQPNEKIFLVLASEFTHRIATGALTPGEAWLVRNLGIQLSDDADVAEVEDWINHGNFFAILNSFKGCMNAVDPKLLGLCLASVEKLSEDLVLEAAHAIALKPLIGLGPSENISDIVKFLPTGHERELALTRWSNSIDSSTFTIDDFVRLLPILVHAKAAQAEKIGKRLTVLVNSSIPPDAVAKALAGFVSCPLVKHSKVLYQYALNSFQPGKSDEIGRLLSATLLFRRFFPEVSVARIHRQASANTSLDGILACAEAGSWNADMYEGSLKGLMVAVESEISPRHGADLVRAACAYATALTASGDLAWVGVAPEKFLVPGGLSEEQRMDFFERLRIRDILKLIRNLEIVNHLSTTLLVDLAFTLATARLSDPKLEACFSEVDRRVVLGKVLDSYDTERFIWAHAMVLKKLPSWFKIPSYSSLADAELLNIGFACAAADRSDVLEPLVKEATRRTPASFQVGYLSRLNSFLAELATSQEASTVPSRSASLTKRPTWRQALQVALATHGVFGSTVEVSPAVGSFPVDAFDHKRKIAVELDRPLNYIRDLDGKVVAGDAFVVLSRRVISKDYSVVNIKLRDWIAVPSGDIEAQIKFVRGLIGRSRRR